MSWKADKIVKYSNNISQRLKEKSLPKTQKKTATLDFCHHTISDQYQWFSLELNNIYTGITTEDCKVKSKQQALMTTDIKLAKQDLPSPTAHVPMLTICPLNDTALTRWKKIMKMLYKW